MISMCMDLFHVPWLGKVYIVWQCRLALVVFFTTPPSLPLYFYTDRLFSVTTPPYFPLTYVTGFRAVCGASWLGYGDCQPWERYFSSGALAPNLHKVMLLIYLLSSLVLTCTSGCTRFRTDPDVEWSITIINPSIIKVSSWAGEWWSSMHWLSILLIAHGVWFVP